MEKEYISFRYKSIENFARLLVTIQYENTHNPREISVFHERLDKESDDFFGKILVKLYPQGATIGETVKNICVDYFKGFDVHDLSVEKVKKFILDNFIVRSSFSSVESIARDARYIHDCIIFSEHDEGW